MESVEDKASDIRTIFKTDEFEEFYNGLDEKVKDKFEYTFELVQTVYAIPVKYVKREQTYMRCVYQSGLMSIEQCCSQLITVMSYYQQK